MIWTVSFAIMTLLMISVFFVGFPLSDGPIFRVFDITSGFAIMIVIAMLAGMTYLSAIGM